MMGGDPRAEGAPEILVAERVQVGDRQSADVPVGDLPEQGGLGAGGQVHPGGEQLLDGGVAPGAAEDEPDRGQQPGLLQDPRHLGPRGAVPREPRMDVTAEGTGAVGSLTPAERPRGRRESSRTRVASARETFSNSRFTFAARSPGSSWRSGRHPRTGPPVSFPPAPAGRGGRDVSRRPPPRNSPARCEASRRSPPRC